MFFGAVPTACIEQMFAIINFHSWKRVYVCCSGGFRIERGLRAKYPDLEIHSNDVSVFSCAFGWMLTDQPVPIEFTGKLAFMEPHLGDDPAKRCAAVLIASDIARYATGKESPYKIRHLKHYQNTIADRVVEGAAKLRAVAGETQIQSFFAGDWRKHVEQAIGEGAGIAAFPPFFKGDYEAMFKFINENVVWPAPAYDLYDPRDLEKIVARIDDSGVPYCVLSDQKFETLKPVMEYVQGRKVPHFCYGTATRSSLRYIPQKHEPFLYAPLEMARVKPDSVVRVTEADYRQANYIKDIYLAKSITHTPGLFSYFVFIDEMLAGVLIYSMSKFGGIGDRSVYLLSDVVTSREGKASKLVAKIALSRDITRLVATRLMSPIEAVITTARTKNAVSMKYRGIYKLTSRKPDTETEGHNMLNYRGQVIDDTPQQIFDWWFEKHGRKAMETARNRAATVRSQGAEAATA